MAEQPNGTNGTHPKDHNQLTDLSTLKKALANIEKIYDRMESEKGKYMAAMKEERERIKEQYQWAKDKGMSKTALRMLVEARQLQRKLERLVSDADDDIADEYQAYADAVLGWEETPLAQAVSSVGNDIRDIRVTT